MIPYAEALTILQTCAQRNRPAIETAGLNDMRGRVLAADVISPENVPPFDNSAMDGFAVSTAGLGSPSDDSPVDLKVVDTVAAGDGDLRRLERGECFSIMTGAVLPEGCDAVIRIEDVETMRWITGMPGGIRVRRPVSPGENVRRRGTDFAVGVSLASAGDLLTAHHVMAFASAGVTNVPVFRRLRVLVINTGRELVPAARPRLENGEIRNSTGPLLQSLLPSMGLDVVRAVTVTDDLFLYKSLLRQILNEEDIDIVVSTGAVSVGEFDFVKSALLAENARVHFHKVAIRPGKPLLFAEMESSAGRPVWFFGAPGNPVSTAVALRFFLNPFLRASFSRPAETPLRLRLNKAIRKPEGLRCFFKGSFSHEGTETEIECLEGQASYVVRSLLLSRAWVALTENDELVSPGKAVEVFRLFDDWQGGSHD